MYSSNFVFEHVVRGNFSKFFHLNRQKKKPVKTEENTYTPRNPLRTANTG
jgi:hypothetical protein